MVKENIPEYSVTEISKSIKQLLDDTFGYVRVRGEISGLKQAASGHVYLNLKDESAIINGIIWKSNVSRLSFQPHDGLEVICKGRLTTGYSDRYPGRSDYSIQIDSLMPSGEGALMALLEQRKKKFAASGLFDQIHKKQIPEYPHRIGVITSSTGAVIQDILHRIEERYPLNVILWPVPVQGDDSSELITQAIRGFNNIDIEESKLSSNNFAILIERISDKTILGKIAKSILEEVWESGDDVDNIIKDKGLVQIQDESILEEIAQEIINNNLSQVEAYKGGKDKLFGFFVGQVMKETQGKANPKSVNDILKNLLNS